MKNYGQLPYPKDKWNMRFGFFYYNDREIFDWDQLDMDRKAKEFADAGINHVITFSVTHFRWSFYRNWDKIYDVLRRMVIACHKYGIYVTEHHSAEYMYNAADPTGKEFLFSRIKMRKSSLDNWPGLLEDCTNGIITDDGHSLLDMVQYDPVTGEKYVDPEYKSYIICVNHPDYAPLYEKHLEELYKLGIDGIMTDDINFRYGSYDDRYDAPTTCACIHCRRKFKEQTGFELPAAGADWIQWRRKKDEEPYAAWLKFRHNSLLKFHKAIKDHYEAMGLQMLRPWYNSTAIYWTNPGGYAFDDLPALDWVQTENRFDDIIRYTWPEWAVEHNQRFSLGRVRGIPAMAFYYPDREDTVRFAWGLSLSGGIQYSGTNHANINLIPFEKPLREFEIQHRSLLRNSRKFASIGYYFSRTNRNCSSSYEERSRKIFSGWMQACEMQNIPYDLIMPEELDKLGQYKVIVLSEIILLNQIELETLQKFVSAGGKLVWIGKTGMRDENNVTRDTNTLKNLWDLSLSIFDDTRPEVIYHNYGKGQLVLIPFDEYFVPLRRRVGVDRWNGNNIRRHFKPWSIQERLLGEQLEQLFCNLLNNKPDMKINNAPEGLLFHPFLNESGNTVVIHILNAVKTLELPECGQVAHKDHIPFPKLKQDSDILINLEKNSSWNLEGTLQALLLCPEKTPTVLNIESNANSITIQLPANKLNFYSLLAINSKN